MANNYNNHICFGLNASSCNDLPRTYVQSHYKYNAWTVYIALETTRDEENCDQRINFCRCDFAGCYLFGLLHLGAFISTALHYEAKPVSIKKLTSSLKTLVASHSRTPPLLAM